MRRFVVPVESGGVTQQPCRLIRTRIRWSQEALAEKAALSVSAMRRFELAERSSHGCVLGSIRRAFEAPGIFLGCTHLGTKRQGSKAEGPRLRRRLGSREPGARVCPRGRHSTFTHVYGGKAPESDISVRPLTARFATV
ncbi:helix-turn-helix transcriptional regulator [Azospirillum sp. INR13]|uniref:helix-turn-helix domain-containing protein n=1 Tax=Azospirillum sp. INR13 TaxID=2596919 RepID=UPI001891F95C|nr:helix-turn-helix domain-containing protein [Azospirillum sp. INR13]MBF5094223.1 helix-turn-helix transcriptional regulator [Azospirillum sp. INR13]